MTRSLRRTLRRSSASRLSSPRSPRRSRELERHRQAIEAIEKDRKPLKAKLDDLQAPPVVEPEPNPDAVPMVPLWRSEGGRVNYAPKHVADAMREAQRMGLSGPDVTKFLIDMGVIDASAYGL